MLAIDSETLKTYERAQKQPEGGRFGQITTSYCLVGLVLGVMLAYLVLSSLGQMAHIKNCCWRGSAGLAEVHMPWIQTDLSSNPGPAAYCVISGKIL